VQRDLAVLRELGFELKPNDVPVPKVKAPAGAGN
jgi:hypothetical protein